MAAEFVPGFHKKSCAIHFSTHKVGNKDLVKFSCKTVETCHRSANVWVLESTEREESSIARQFLTLLKSHPTDSEVAAKELYYHQHCYLKFTSRKRQPNTETGPSPKKLRARSQSTSRSAATQGSKPATHLWFPNLCIICGKETSWVRVKGHKERDRLVKCESDGKALYAAAVHQKAEHVLRHIRYQDPAAIEVKYHKKCFSSFVRHTPKDVPSQNLGSSVKSDNVSDSDIESYFSNEDQGTGCLQSTDHEDADSDFSFSVKGKPVDMHDINHDLYKGALALRHVLKMAMDEVDKLPWPPKGQDFTYESLKSQVPDILFNFLAWACDATEEDVTSERVALKQNFPDAEQKLYAIAHDLVGLTCKKNTLKQLMLSLATRHITGSKRLVEILSGYGHGASYSSVMEHNTALAEGCLEESALGIPSTFKKKQATTLVWDNNDFCEETLSGHGTTHCTTGIIVQRVVPLQEASETDTTVKDHTSENKTPQQQRSYKKAFSAPKEEIIPFRNKRKQPPGIELLDDSVDDKASNTTWNASVSIDLSYYISKAASPTLLPGWAGFNEKISPQSQLPVSQIGYLPIINASPTELNTVNTVLHQSVKIADELELPAIVVVMDQALYSKAQEIRWSDERLKLRIVLRMGVFHITMNYLGVLGKRFRDAGLEDIMVESGLVAAGSLSGVFSGHHYNRSIRSHKIVAEAMACLMWQAFITSLSSEERNEAETISKNLCDVYVSNPSTFMSRVASSDVLQVIGELVEFVQKRSEASPTFYLWQSYIEYVCILQQLLRATRSGNWDLHLLAVRNMLPLFFAYDRCNYARYLPCYYAEMKNLPRTHYDIHRQLASGDFTVGRQEQPFTQSACDQVAEQTVNKQSKTQGGLRGKTRKRGAVQCWILTCHIRGEITSHCERNARRHTTKNDTRQSKHLLPCQVATHNKLVQEVCNTVQEMINPFEVEDSKLLNVSSGVVASEGVQKDLLTAYSVGEEAYQTFAEDRLQAKPKVSLFDPIKRSKLTTFSQQGKRVKCAAGNSDVTLKAGKALLTWMLRVGKVENESVKDTLTYSLIPVPPCLGHYDGALVKTNKALLLQVFDAARVPHLDLERGHALIVDGMAFIQAFTLGNCMSFDDLAENLLDSLLFEARRTNADRIDFVLDTYPKDSIKHSERQRRASAGVSKIKIVKGSQPLPKQWKKFLASGENKTSLGDFLFKNWSEQYRDGLILFMTHGNQCHKIQSACGYVTVEPQLKLYSDHEEADTRLLLHAHHASETHNSIAIRSPDTDVVIITAAVCDEIGAHLQVRQSCSPASQAECRQDH